MASQVKDIRDTNSKVATLPKDLKLIADEMLAEKFGLSTAGEVMEKEKPKKERAPVEGTMGWRQETTTTSATASTGVLSERQLKEAMYAMGVDPREGYRQERFREELEYLLKTEYKYLEEWVRTMEYRTDMIAYAIEGRDYMGQGFGFYIDASILHDSPVTFLRAIEQRLNDFSRQLMSPLRPLKRFR